MTMITSTPETSTDRTVDDVFGQLITELGASLGLMITDLGRRTGIWQALRDGGPSTAEELAVPTGIPAPLVREWLRSQAAAGYLGYDPATDRFTLPEAVAIALLDAPGGATVTACLEMMRSMLDGYDDLVASYPSDQGYGWDRRDFHHWHGADALTRAQLPAPVIAAAIEALGLHGAGTQGAVLDVGCGFGYPTRTMAAVLPTRIVGIDYHARSIEEATRAASAEGVADRVSFHVASATDLPGDGFRLITFFDSLHDLGDPVAALEAARAALAPDGAVLVCETPAADRVADNLNPLGRMYYAVSALICTPNAISQQEPTATDEPLGTFAGPARLTEVAHRAGFGQVKVLDVAGAQSLFLDLRP